MPETADLAAKLEAEGRKLSGFFMGMSDAAWVAEIYSEGSAWTVRNILAHLASAERAFLSLLDGIRQGGPGVSEDFVIDRYNASQQRKFEGVSSGELLREYEAARGAMVAFVRRLSASDLEKRGRHPYLGETTLREMIKMIYIHNQTHYRDARRVLGH
jgi:uncharacterized damage-inducible protein DinB